MPLGTAGAIRYAGDSLKESVVVFNGDVLTEVDLAAVLRLHRERKAKATIVLHRWRTHEPTAWSRPTRPVTSSDFSRSRARTRLPATRSTQGSRLEPDTFDRIPKDTAWSIEAKLFPVADRAWRDVRRLHLRRLLDRHRYASQIPAGPSRHHGRARPRRRSRGRRARGCRPTRVSTRRRAPSTLFRR